MTTIKEQYHSNMTLAEAEKLVLSTLKSVMEEKIAKENIELSVVRTDTRQLETRSSEYVENLLKTLA
jgi:20S proteasome alpha/beta subunit